MYIFDQGWHTRFPGARGRQGRRHGGEGKPQGRPGHDPGNGARGTHQRPIPWGRGAETAPENAGQRHCSCQS